MKRPEWLRVATLGGFLLAAAACGGGNAEENGAPPAPPAAPAADAEPAQADTAADTAAAQRAQQVQLVRESFGYRGGGRDPFASLLRSGSVRPMPQDLRVTGITYDPVYPLRSVATLRDTTDGKRYALRVGDQVGRVRVAEIRPEAVVLILEELGVERQVVLALRRRQEGTP